MDSHLFMRLFRKKNIYTIYSEAFRPIKPHLQCPSIFRSILFFSVCLRIHFIHRNNHHIEIQLFETKIKMQINYIFFCLLDDVYVLHCYFTCGLIYALFLLLLLLRVYNEKRKQLFHLSSVCLRIRLNLTSIL